MVAHVSNRPRCRRCKEFRPTHAVQTGRGVAQLCEACRLEIAYSGDCAMPQIAKEVCGRCQGRGELVLETGSIMCRDCDGAGWVSKVVKLLEPPTTGRTRSCLVCGGAGAKIGCAHCNHTGLEPNA